MAQWVQRQLDGGLGPAALDRSWTQLALPRQECLHTRTFKRNDKKRSTLRNLADDVMDVRALDPAPTTCDGPRDLPCRPSISAVLSIPANS